MKSPRSAPIAAAALAVALLLAATGWTEEEGIPPYEVPAGFAARSPRAELARRLVAEILDGDAVMSREASLALATLGADAAGEAIGALPSAPWHARALLVFALAESGLEEIGPLLCLAARDPAWAVREQAARGLWRIPGPEALAALLDLAASPSWRVRKAAAQSLGLRGRREPGDRPDILGNLLPLARDADRDVSLAALASLGELRAEEARALFLEGFGSDADDEERREICYGSLLHLPGTEEDLLTALRRALDDPDERFFFAAAARYAELTGPTILDTHTDRLLRGLREDSPAAAKVFEKIGEAAVPLLLRDLRDSFGRPVRRPAAGDPTRTVLDIVTRILGPEGAPVMLEIFLRWEEAFPARRYAAVLGRRHYPATFRPVFRETFGQPAFAELRGVILEGLATGPDSDLSGPLGEVLRSGPPLLVQSALDILLRRPRIDLTETLLAILAAPRCEPALATKCMDILNRQRRPEALAATRNLLARPEPELRQIGAESIRPGGDASAVLSLLTGAFEREDGLDRRDAPPAPSEEEEATTGEALPASPVWARREGVVRAILTAAHRVAGPAALPLLERAAGDADVPVRIVALEQLADLDAPGVREAITTVARRETDRIVLAKALAALTRHATPEDRDLFRRELTGPDEDRREATLRSLERSKPAMAPGLVKEAFDPGLWEAGSRKLGVEILAGSRETAHVAFIADLLGGDPDPEVRATCAHALGESGAPEAVDALLLALPGPEKDFADLGREEREIAQAVIEALGSLRADRAGPALLDLLRREWPLALADPTQDRVHFQMARLILTALGRTGFPEAVPVLLRCLLGPELYRAHALLGGEPPREPGGLHGTLVAALVQWSDDRLLEEGERELSRLARSGDLGRIGESYLDSLAGLFADPRRDEVRSPRPRRGFAGLLDRTIVAVAPRDTPLDLRAFDRLARRAGDDGRFAEAAAAQASYRDLLAVLDPWNFAEEEKRVLATLDVLEGLAEAVAGREEEGFARCIAGRDRDPEDPLVLNAFAWYLAVAGFRLAEALPAAEEAARRAPSEPLILDTLGFVLSRLGRYEEAVPWLDEAVDLDRKAAENAPRETPRRRDPGILNRLAVACAKVGRVEEAATLNEEARKMDDTIPPLP